MNRIEEEREQATGDWNGAERRGRLATVQPMTRLDWLRVARLGAAVAVSLAIWRVLWIYAAVPMAQELGWLK